jgi:hypothetical protein
MKSDSQKRLNKDGFGVTGNRKGENFYENSQLARRRSHFRNLRKKILSA